MNNFTLKQLIRKNYDILDNLLKNFNVIINAKQLLKFNSCFLATEKIRYKKFDDTEYEKTRLTVATANNVKKIYLVNLNESYFVKENKKECYNKAKSELEKVVTLFKLIRTLEITADTEFIQTNQNDKCLQTLKELPKLGQLSKKEENNLKEIFKDEDLF